jgi:hypothetical protein
MQRDEESHGEVALLFEGGPVIGSQEIRLQFATQILDSYQTLVAIIAAEKGGAELKARGSCRKRSRASCSLRICFGGLLASY